MASLNIRVNKLFLLITLLLFLLSHNSECQTIEVIPSSQVPFTPENIIKNVFLDKGLEITNITFKGNKGAVGYFQKADPSISIQSGIVLSTGDVNNIKQTGNQTASTSFYETNPVDLDLQTLSNGDQYDLVYYEIEFIPHSSRVGFNYMFASEEYSDYVCSDSYDVFGIFLTGPKPSGGNYSAQNFAFLPNTTQEININSVNNGNPLLPSCTPSNTTYFHDNTSGNELVFNGYLDKFNVEFEVIPCETYTLKIAITDIKDELFDSAIFLEAGSLKGDRLEITVKNNSIDNTLVEGGTSGKLELNISRPELTDRDVNITFLGDGQNGIDILNIPTTIVIPAGDTTVSIDLTAIDDGITEGIEKIGFAVSIASCLMDTVWIKISDPLLYAPFLQDTITQCDNTPLLIEGALNIEVSEDITFTNDKDLLIFPDNFPFFSLIEVSNLMPDVLNIKSLKEICIDSLSHPRLEDLDIFVISPSGKFLELSTDNGEDGGDPIEVDYMINTCFSPTATIPIHLNNPLGAPSSEIPFTGKYLPEGDFNSLWLDPNEKANGTWSLLLVDDTSGKVGQLHSWSITFYGNYKIDYKWSPNIDISCTDCPNPTITPSTDRWYYLTINDTYGSAEIKDSIFIQRTTPLASPSIDCDNSVDGAVTFSWNNSDNIDGYKLFNGTDTINTLDTFYTFSSLDPNTIIDIDLIVFNACETISSSASCSTKGCSKISSTIDKLSHETCYGANNGIIEVSSTLGKAPYNFSIPSLGQNNNDGIFTDLQPGNYNIEITDSLHCLDTLQATIIGAIEVLATPEITEINCYNDSTGTIAFETTQGNGPFNFEWSNGTTDSINTNLSAGTYSLTITDKNNCSFPFLNTKIENPTPIIIQGTPLLTDCNDENSGKIDLTISGGSNPYTYLWNDPGNSTSKDISGVTIGDYSVTVTDNLGCDNVSSFTIENTSTNLYDFKKNDVACMGTSSGNIEITPIDSSITIQWEDGSNNFIKSNLEGGKYAFTISETGGCQYHDTISIEEPSAEINANFSFTSPTCFDSYDAELIVHSFGGTPPYKYSLNGNDFQEDSIFSNIQGGQQYLFIEDKNGCIASVNTDVVIQRPDSIEVNLISPNEAVLGVALELNSSIKNVIGDYEGLWTIGEEEYPCFPCDNALLIEIKDATNLSLQVIDKNGCIGKDTKTINIIRVAEIYVANVFTPNNDGYNDDLKVFATERTTRKIISFEVYDRWGELMFSQKDIKPKDIILGWDGTYNGEIMTQGVYMWTATIERMDGVLIHKSGSTTLLKTTE